MLSEKGMTLLDSLMSLVVLGVGLLGIAGLLIYTMNGDVSAKQTTSAVTLAQARIERAVSVGFGGLSLINWGDSELCVPSNGIEDYGTITVPFSFAGNCTTPDPSATAFRRETILSQPGNEVTVIIVTVTVRWFDIAHNAHSFQANTAVAQ